MLCIIGLLGHIVAFDGKMSPKEKRRDLTIKEVAYELSVGRRWVRKYLGTPLVPPYIRRGKLIRFPRDLFSEWEKRQTVYGDTK